MCLYVCLLAVVAVVEGIRRLLSYDSAAQEFHCDSTNVALVLVDRMTGNIPGGYTLVQPVNRIGLLLVAGQQRLLGQKTYHWAEMTRPFGRMRITKRGM